MAEQTLLKTLEEDARGQAAGILSDAEARAREIIEGAEQESASVKEARLRELETTLEKERSARINSARVRAVGALIEVRRNAIEAVLEGTVESFGKMPPDEYSRLLGRLCSNLEKDLRGTGETRPVLRVNPADIGRLNNPGVEFVADPEVTLGAAFVSADGKVRKELTIPSIIRKKRRALETLIDKAIFGQGEKTDD